jgi:hypothetical protein
MRGILKQIVTGVLAAGLAVGGSLIPVIQATAAPIDINESTQIGLFKCESTIELDCVESFGFIDSTGAYISATVSGTYRPAKAFVDQNGNTVYQGNTSWTATVDGIEKNAVLDVPLQSPKYVIFKNDVETHYGASLRPSVDGKDLLNTKVRFVIRTSYLRPQNVQLVADEADFKQKAITGGNAWTFEGKGTAVSAYTTDVLKKSQDWSAKADIDTYTLHFIIHHADKDLTHGYWPARCAGKGYSVQAFNSNAAGEPHWNPSSQSLDFAVPSPHLMANGLANKGFFKLWTTDAYMNCQWIGNNLASATGITVSIVDQDGSTQSATSQVIHANGRLYVEATGFHYSAPTIKLKATKTQTIYCASNKNKKIVKKVTGVSPKCPTAYSKVKSK